MTTTQPSCTSLDQFMGMLSLPPPWVCMSTHTSLTTTVQPCHYFLLHVQFPRNLFYTQTWKDLTLGEGHSGVEGHTAPLVAVELVVFSPQLQEICRNNVRMLARATWPALLWGKPTRCPPITPTAQKWAHFESFSNTCDSVQLWSRMDPPVVFSVWVSVPGTGQPPSNKLQPTLPTHDCF